MAHHVKALILLVLFNLYISGKQPKAQCHNLMYHKTLFTKVILNKHGYKIQVTCSSIIQI